MGILSTNKKIINLGQGYSAGNGISIDDYVISYTGNEGQLYNAGPNIDIYDDQDQLYISGKDWSADIANASSNAYEQATALIPPEFDPSYISGVVDSKLDSTAFSTVSGDYATTSYVDMSDNLTYSRATAWGNQNLAPLNSVANNSAKWNEIEVYEQNSATYLTAHQDISNKLDTTAFSTVSGNFLTAHQVIPSAKWEDASDVVQSNSAQWSENTGDEEVNNAVYNNSANWNDITVYQTNSASYLTAHQDISNKLDTTAFSTVSGTFLTAHQPISANEWNSVYETVETNSGSWTGGGGTSLTGDAQGAVDEVYSNSANWSDISAYQSNSANYMTNLFIAKYGQSTYAEVNNAVTSNKIVYCQATPNGSTTRMAFLAYVGTNNYEFQYYRSITGHNFSNQGDEVYIYTCNKTGTTWTSSKRDAYTQISASKGLSGYYTNGTYRLAATGAATTGDLNTVSSILSGAIDYLSGNAGKTYTGISPIVVNNTTNEISADSQDITFGEGLDFTNGVLTVTGAGTTYTGDAQGALDEVYTNSGVWLTAHQSISADEWNSVYDTVESNSGSWTNDYVPLSATRVAIGSDNQTNNNYNDFVQGQNNNAWNISHIFIQGTSNSASNGGAVFLQGAGNSAGYGGCDFVQGQSNKSSGNYNFIQGEGNLALDGSFSQGFHNSSYNWSQTFGKGNIISNSGMAIGTYNKTSSDVSFVIGNGSANSARSDSFVIYHDGSVSAMGKISANGVELGAGVPQSAFDELKTSYDALSSLFATYSGQWLLPNQGE